MKLTFFGAAQQVTGSKFLLETTDGFQILIDCGLDLERKFTGSGHTPYFVASDIDVVLLTHAHLDHCGSIPDLIQAGFKGQVICTSPTAALSSIILKDCRELRSKEKKKKDPNSEINEQKLTEEAEERFFCIPFEKDFPLNDNVVIKYFPAGHLLGAAHILITVQEDGKEKTIFFSGDIGRKNYPLLPDPVNPDKIDYLVCESTYGDRYHEEEKNGEEFLYELILDFCVNKKGRLLIPSFSVGRTQSLLHTLRKLEVKRKLPSIKIFADSPMAESCTRVYEKFNAFLNEEAKEMYDKHSLFNFDNLHIIQSFKESREISNYLEPCIIISSSGMLTGGRMARHIRKNLHNPYCAVLMVGYAAEGTPGHDLLHGKLAKSGQMQASIFKTDVFSGHADRNGLESFIQSFDQNQLKKIFLVHGEYRSMTNFKYHIEKNHSAEVFTPSKGESFSL